MARLLSPGLVVLIAACVIRTPRVDPSIVTPPPGVNVVSAKSTDSPPTAVASSTPTAVDQARSLISQSAQEASNGNDALAVELLQKSIGLVDDDSMRTSARLRIAKIQLSTLNTGAALETLRGLAGTDAQILTGRAYMQAGAMLSATGSFSQAIQANSIISPYLNLWIGTYYLEAAQPEKAIGPLRAAVDSAPSIAIAQARREKLALALQNSGNYSGAVNVYDAIIASSKRPEYLAHITVERAGVLRAQGRVDETRKTLQRVVTVFPDTSAAFDAINNLLGEGQTVDELQRGIVDYHNDAYKAAQQAFARAAVTHGATNEELLYWSGLTLVELDNSQQALKNFDALIARGRTAVRYLDALVARADTLARAGNSAEAIKAYRLFALQAAGHPQQSRAFLRAASLADAAGLFADAAAVYADAAGNDIVLPAFRADVLIRSAVESYRLGNFAQAAARAGQASTVYSVTTTAQEAQLWLAKAMQKTGDIKGAAETLDRLATSNGYFGLRARELARDQAPFTNAAQLSIRVGATSEPSPDQLAEVGKWLTLLPSNTLSLADAMRPPAGLAADIRFMRGGALWQLGFQNEANDELSSLYASYASNPHALTFLALYLREIGHYRLSITCAERAILSAIGRSNYDVREIPRVLGELAYPTYYSDLVQSSAREYGIDPLLLFSVVRQESLFQTYAESSAAARGLMQIVPATGREIAQKLGWPINYSDQDLNRANVSLTFGASYLVRMKELTKGDWYVALSANNAGAGRALKWQEYSNGDPDLYYAAISLDEPRAYIRGITDNYVTYRALYGLN